MRDMGVRGILVHCADYRCSHSIAINGALVMRDMCVRGLLVYCADYRCSHSIAISGDGWPDEHRRH
jgi:hypothetical protein